MPRRSRNPRLVKIHRTYTVEEAACLLGVHKNTIREWIRCGLPLVDDRRPALIRGAALADFMRQRRSSKKRPCSPGEIYCVRCRCPQSPMAGRVKYSPITPTYGDLIGECPACAARIYRRVSRARLDAVGGKLAISFSEAA